jgi:prevent-host-death family protein
MKISAGKFKARCLKLMDEVHSNHEEIIITKYGRPVAKLVAVKEKETKSLFGCMKGTVTFKEDIVKPLRERWYADD